MGRPETNDAATEDEALVTKKEMRGVVVEAGKARYVATRLR